MKQEKGKRKQLLLTIQGLLEREDCTLDDIAEAMIAGGYDVRRPAQGEVGSQKHGKRRRSALPPDVDVDGPAAPPAS
jgi:hypothetical protein